MALKEVHMDRMFSNLAEKGKVLVFGHRGMSEFFPENTMLSFSECAKESGVDGVELDVHVCKSGEVVVAHDFSLKRTAGLDREIEELTLDELKAIDVGSFKDPKFSDCRIPLLSELFSTFGDRFIYDVELKVKKSKVNRDLSRKVYSIIKEFGLQDSVVVSSFNPFALRAFRGITGGTIPTADIFEDSPNIPRPLRYGGGRFISGATFQKPRYKQVDASYLEHHGKLPIISWTVNTAEDASRLLQLNSEGMRVFGLIGNNPVMLASEVAKNAGNGAH